MIERTPQEEIPEGFFMLGLVLPRVAVIAATLSFSEKYPKIAFIKATAIWVQFALGSIGITSSLYRSGNYRYRIRNCANALATKKDHNTSRNLCAQLQRPTKARFTCVLHGAVHQEKRVAKLDFGYEKLQHSFNRNGGSCFSRSNSCIKQYLHGFG